MSRDRYTRQASVHPRLAHKIANHVAENVWVCSRLEQVHPGVFVHPQNGRAILVMGAAPISGVAETALRRSHLLDELLVLHCASGQIVAYGPKIQYTEEEWVQEKLRCVKATQDVNVVLSVFEYACANEIGRMCCLAETSDIIARVLPGVPTSRAERHAAIKAGGWSFLDHYEAGVEKILELTRDESEAA